ncbi:polyprenyl synthetase family protein [bacterium]|nr:polyprenyl synthetase family protein [bacterium]
MKNLINLVDKKLDEYLQITYPEEIFKAMKYTLMLPGKRLRPVMCLETVRMLNGDISKALPTACAIEMLHAQSLIHDDLPCMDNDDFRRGKPSNHKVFGEANAVLAGDALLTFAPQLIIEKTQELPPETVLKLVHEYTKFAGAYALIAGQVVDIESEGGKLTLSAKETLDFIHLNKTAALFRLAIRCGAIISRTDDTVLNELDKFAKKFGLAFQIYDDIMDEISTFEELGKTIGKDKNSGKLTYVSLYGLDEAKKKFELLINDCYAIVEKYNSTIFKDILNKLRDRILGV